MSSRPTVTRELVARAVGEISAGEEAEALKSRLEKAEGALDRAGYVRNELSGEWKPLVNEATREAHLLRDAVEVLREENDGLRAQVAALEAERDELAKQEPVGHFAQRLGRFVQLDADCWPKGHEHSIPLYADPPVAAPVRLTDSDVVDLFQAWNTTDGASHADLILSVETAVLRANGLHGGVLTMNAPEVKDWSKVGWMPVGDSAEMARREAIRKELQARVISCPFCGHEPMLHVKNWPGERDAITCQCGASMAFDGKTVFYLIEQWNRRVAQ